VSDGRFLFLIAKERPMLRTFVSGKIHQLKVTGLQPKYSGSCLIGPELLAAAGIEPFERVEIYSLTDTARIATYVFPGAAEGEFTLNGGGALYFRIEDRAKKFGDRQMRLGRQVIVQTNRDHARSSGNYRLLNLLSRFEGYPSNKSLPTGRTPEKVVRPKLSDKERDYASIVSVIARFGGRAVGTAGFRKSRRRWLEYARATWRRDTATAWKKCWGVKIGETAPRVRCVVTPSAAYQETPRGESNPCFEPGSVPTLGITTVFGVTASRPATTRGSVHMIFAALASVFGRSWAGSKRLPASSTTTA
jgi:hypothetical protein